ncbi:MAG: DUF4857 domain-containing protein [Bacteroidota bacterium]
MKNILITRIILAITIILVASIYLPEFYWKITKEEAKSVSVYYSVVKDEFVFIKSDIRGAKYVDQKGDELTREEFEEAVPLLNFRQLFVSGKMPDTINGKAIEPKEVKLNNFSLRIRPEIINYNLIQLFPLMESQSGRIRLELPPDLFRITDRMEFITSLTNQVDEKKSRAFTDALLKEGFNFPAKKIYGNLSTMKPFDEGYFVIDSSGKIYHIKMVKGEPFCVQTSIPQNIDVAYILVSENELREFYSLLITKKSEVYFISYDNYRLIKLPVEDYNYETDVMTIRGDLFNRQITYSRENEKVKSIVTNRDYNIVSTYEDNSKGKEVLYTSLIAPYLFPFELSIEESKTPMINFYFSFYDLHYLILSAVLTIVAIIYFRKKKIDISNGLIYYAVVLVTGLYGFIAIMCIRDFNNDSNI